MSEKERQKKPDWRAYNESPAGSRGVGDLLLGPHRAGGGYAATHTPGVIYGDMFGELPDLYQQS